MIIEPSKKENLQETLDAIKINNNPYFICVVDYSQNEKGTYLAIVKGNREDIYKMIQLLIEQLP